jgi:hypothetical protein
MSYLFKALDLFFSTVSSTFCHFGDARAIINFASAPINSQQKVFDHSRMALLCMRTAAENLAASHEKGNAAAKYLISRSKRSGARRYLQ